MTFAWYGHLKMREEFSWFASLPLIGVIAFSWAIAFFEYCLQVPANRLGFRDSVWGIERSGFFNGREKWAKGFENQRV